ncbi:Peptidyl-prolyl cis-trans isomerase B [Oligella urethralis]|uniref:Peptidyl-prolyl cis-trans isomerase n=2 Tax=Alcaligenaceae TaxID=506 RepID=A0A2N6QGX1_9BURK|nr:MULTISPECIES: peptidylprolyl isomerase [Oligella]PMC18823.1 peptidylprolyl isomerase [Oligella urethralis]SPY06990.1 Peptidyl-prolyl cis-trans isomerase B [Oligella urethralis]SUA59824.1 Peptidyl-prolyl cis-trans isomerase B [Oligella urethralis]SUA60053.1 Peptidyl-prolyl cis-trans isomerase B [Oligella urethralis]
MMLKSSRLVALTLAATFTMAPATTVLSQTNNQKDSSAMSNTRVKLVTNMGDIVLELDGAKAPITTQNFLDYVKNGFYSNVIFHRVIPNFMIQGGGFEPGMNQKNTNAPITNEADNGLKNDKYTIAMARTQDPHSASAQFFINTNNNDFLNFTAPSVQGWGYAVFGKVVEGTEVVDAIEKVATGTRGFHGDVPREDVIIQSAEIVE